MNFLTPSLAKFRGSHDPHPLNLQKDPRLFKGLILRHEDEPRSIQDDCAKLRADLYRYLLLGTTRAIACATALHTIHCHRLQVVIYDTSLLLVVSCYVLLLCLAARSLRSVPAVCITCGLYNTITTVQLAEQRSDCRHFDGKLYIE